LLPALTDILLAEAVVGRYRLPASYGSLIARLHRLNAVQDEQYDESGNVELSVRLSKADWDRALHQEGVKADQLEIVKFA
jgi:hypothetical protein